MEEILLKVSIIHKAFGRRSDLNGPVRRLLDSLLGPVEGEDDAGWNYCRKLRVMLLYSSLIKEQHFKALIDACLRMLRSDEHSVAFKEAEAILKELEHDSYAR